MILKNLKVLFILSSILNFFRMLLSNSFVQTGHKFQLNEILTCTVFSLISHIVGHRRKELCFLNLGFSLLV